MSDTKQIVWGNEVLVNPNSNVVKNTMTFGGKIYTVYGWGDQGYLFPPDLVEELKVFVEDNASDGERN